MPANNKMQIEQWAVDSLIPYEKNPRVITPAAIDKVAVSIKEFGWQQPIVCDDKGLLVAGHTRLLAAKQLGLKWVPVLVARDLSPAQLAAYRIADNRTNSESTWQSELLSKEVLDLDALDYDLEILGFSSEELDRLCAGEDINFEPQPAEAEGSGTAKNSISLTQDQYMIFLQACMKLRTDESDHEISEGRCLELLSGNFLAG